MKKFSIILILVISGFLVGCSGKAPYHGTPMPDPKTFNGHFGDIDAGGDDLVDWEELKAYFPHATEQVRTTMLLSQAVAQSPTVFALLVSFILLYGDWETSRQSMSMFAAVLAAGLCTGLGSIGPGIGAGMAGASGVEAVARRPYFSQLILRAMLAGQAVAQSTSIYALLVSLILLFVV